MAKMRKLSDASISVNCEQNGKNIILYQVVSQPWPKILDQVKTKGLKMAMNSAP
jgi:hypothetical protein